MEAVAQSESMQAIAQAVASAHAALDAALNEFALREHGLNQREKEVQRMEGMGEEQRKKLAEERAQSAREAAVVAVHNAKASDVVDLSIGGERFVTVPRSTLTQFDNSMLAAMFSGRHHLATDATGKVLLDRDPTMFGYVLDYLRNGGQLPANLPVDEAELQRVKAEFDYFLLGDAFTQQPKAVSLVQALNAYEVHTLWSAEAAGSSYFGNAAVSDRCVCLAYGGDGHGGLVVWDLVTGARHSRTDGDTWGVSILYDAMSMIIDKAIYVFRIDSSGLHQELHLNIDDEDRREFERTGLSEAFVAAVNCYEIIYVWERATGELVHTVRARRVSSFALRGSKLAYRPSHNPPTYKVIDLVSKQVIRSVALPATSWIRHIRLSADEQLLITYQDSETKSHMCSVFPLADASAEDARHIRIDSGEGYDAPVFFADDHVTMRADPDCSAQVVMLDWTTGETANIDARAFGFDGFGEDADYFDFDQMTGDSERILLGYESRLEDGESGAYMLRLLRVKPHSAPASGEQL